MSQRQQRSSTRNGYDLLVPVEDIGLQDTQRHEQESASGTSVSDEPHQQDKDSSSLIVPSRSPSASPHLNKSSRIKRCFTKGWRRVMMISSCAILVIIIANIALLAWCLQQPENNGNRVLFKGDCNKSKTIDVWAHIVINIMSTVVLAASNYGMQVLVAPTRVMIDLAHANQTFLDIGIQSTRNLKAVPRGQKLLWVMLLVGSLPLHLFWNSVIISTDQVNPYSAWVIGQRFVISSTPENSLSNSNYTRFSTVDCISLVKPLLVKNVNSILLVSNITDTNGTDLLLTFFYNPYLDPIQEYQWQCDRPYDPSTDMSCVTSDRDPNNWTFHYWPGSGLGLATVKIEYCLVNTIPDACTVEFLPPLQGIVLFCNILKLASILAVLLYTDSQPLFTLGDAITSFLDDPQPVRSQTLVTAKTIKTSLSGRKSPKPARFYLNGASEWRLGLCFFGIVGYWLLGVGLFASTRTSGQALPLSYIWANGLTSTQPQSMKIDEPSYLNEPPSLLSNVVLANTPQLILSVLYFSYNAIFTSIAVAREWVAYAQSRKGLRTHEPEGEQRPTHFLSLPYRYSFPMMVASGLLHWLLSLSLFVVQIHLDVNSTDHDGLSYDITGVGWSSMALLFLLSLGALMIVVILIAGFRRYPKTVPMVAGNSLAISANCRPINAGKREAIQKLQYGTVIQGNTCFYTFSSEAVLPLISDQEPWPRKLWVKCKASMRKMKK